MYAQIKRLERQIIKVLGTIKQSDLNRIANGKHGKSVD
jgi:hypothetical protein